MLGRSHLLVGAAGWLAVGAPCLEALGHPLSAAETAAGCAVCAGAAMLPDMDHPMATVSRSLGPATTTLSRVIAKLAGGHRNRTHTLPFAALAGLGLAALLAASGGPWVALAVCFLFSSLVVRVLTEADGLACAVISALVAATLITIAPEQDWIYFAVIAGCLFHLVGDLVTPEGVKLLWPLASKRLSLPLVGHTGDWRERFIALVCAGLFCYLATVEIFLPAWH